MNIILGTSTFYDEYADKLSQINVFKGTGNGYELDREPTRLEGLIMLIRLLGSEDEALASGDNNSYFSDVPGWGVKYTNYAYEQGLTKGIGNGLFGSYDLMDAKTYHTFLLRALGYNDAQGDFSWSTASETIYQLGIVDSNYYNQISQQTFLRDHVAKSSYDALYATVKGSSLSLLETLVASGDIDDILAMEPDEAIPLSGYEILDIAGGDLSGNREPLSVVDVGYGDRVYWAYTNENAQLFYVTAEEIILQDESSEPVNSDGRYYNNEANVPGTESPTLDQGHVIADSLGGVANAYNITPQESTLNRYGSVQYME